MTAFLKLYVVSIVAFRALDASWLGLVGAEFLPGTDGRATAARGFPTLVAVVDLAWGATISAAVATIGYWAAGWLGVA